MNLVVTAESRFDRTPDGAIWTDTNFFYSFWERYLAIFDTVSLVARARSVISVPADWKRTDGKRVSVVPVPHYIGPSQYVWRARQVRVTVQGALSPRDAAILRVPSHLANLLASRLWAAQRPYGLEVIGDPQRAYGPGAIRHPLRPYFQWIFTRRQRKQCSLAAAVMYVTADALQHRYPAAPGVFTTHYSEVDLPEEAFVSVPRTLSELPKDYLLIMVGSLAQMYKGPDVLIRALKHCLTTGLSARLIIVGDGKYRQEMESLARALGIQTRVKFLGQLPSAAAVRPYLDQADLFVLPSRTEGLPNALLEAMARAMPCLGSAVGGIPELLSPEDIVPSNDIAQLARSIAEVLHNPQRMAEMSRRNLAHARNYHADLLTKKRRAFYEQVRRLTEDWLQWWPGPSHTQRRI